MIKLSTKQEARLEKFRDFVDRDAEELPKALLLALEKVEMLLEQKPGYERGRPD